MSKKLLLACLMLAVAVFSAIGVAPASAASCSGSTCQGKDPQTYGCSADAVDYTEITFNSDRMEMRYSAKCGAVWNRCTTGNTYSVNNYAAIISYTYAGAYKAKYYVMCSNSRKGDVKWTPMMNFSGQYLRVCGKNELLYGGPGYSGDWLGDSNAACSAAR